MRYVVHTLLGLVVVAMIVSAATIIPWAVGVGIDKLFRWRLRHGWNDAPLDWLMGLVALGAVIWLMGGAHYIGERCFKIPARPISLSELTKHLEKK